MCVRNYMHMYEHYSLQTPKQIYRWQERWWQEGHDFKYIYMAVLINYAVMYIRIKCLSYVYCVWQWQQLFSPLTTLSKIWISKSFLIFTAWMHKTYSQIFEKDFWYAKKKLQKKRQSAWWWEGERGPLNVFLMLKNSIS